MERIEGGMIEIAYLNRAESKSRGVKKKFK